ncbi:heavy metal-responsive transcriptional regulator [Xanthomonas sp. AmX2]|uniref:heavy metal-responsive transcriptional regulator n=1 Tax=Xanthomonas sp. TaxID=29446 RepID=UPI00197F1E55|nr:heavy metal-responsive transcriptional regulator [Xanthomonas sp.]MBN6150207.1 heavy metal-responsive transcriptional regulator [Xanthomonas sp.]
MNIGQLARQSGVPIDTVRYYERQQLLPPPARSASGYRIYRADDVARLQFIRRAKALGFTLEEIADLLDISDRRDGEMAQVKRAAAEKLALIDARLRDMQHMRDALAQLVDACPGHGPLGQCPIIAALNREAP